MFETLEDRRLMSVSALTSSQPTPTPATTSSFEVDKELQQASQLLGTLQSVVNGVIKSMGDALNDIAHRMG